MSHKEVKYVSFVRSFGNGPSIPAMEKSLQIAQYKCHTHCVACSFDHSTNSCFGGLVVAKLGFQVSASGQRGAELLM